MAVGLFGKLPAKRDFIEFGVERPVMEKWDPWLQQAVSASREALGKGWLELYLQAPIWRFWIGPGICGKGVVGVLMPSVDGVGRYFPLSLVAVEEDAIVAPEYDEQTDWFGAAEEVLLGALGDGALYEDVLSALGALPPLKTGLPGEDGETTVPGMFRSLRREWQADFYDRLSCWWVPSHDDGATAARVLMRRGLPDPADYTAMISGKGESGMPIMVGEASNA